MSHHVVYIVLVIANPLQSVSLVRMCRLSLSILPFGKRDGHAKGSSSVANLEEDIANQFGHRLLWSRTVVRGRKIVPGIVFVSHAMSEKGVLYHSTMPPAEKMQK